MGCWNGTCGLSNLSIRYNEPVKIVFLECDVQNVSCDGDGFCFNYKYGKPISHPISAKYNDYGYVEDVSDSELNEQFISQLRKYLNNDNLDFKDIQRIIRKGENVYRGIHGEHYLGYILFKDSIFQELKKKSKYPIGYTKSYKSIVTTYEGILQLQKQIPHDVVNIAKNNSRAKRLYNLTTTDQIPWEDLTDNFRITFCSDMAMLNISDYYRETQKNDFLRDFTRKIQGRAEGCYSSMRFAQEVLSLHMVLGKNNEEIMDLYLLQNFMDDLRKLWVPQGGSGSQDDNKDEHELLSKIILKHIKDVKKEEREMYD
jgi:hypothetical protein